MATPQLVLELLLFGTGGVTPQAYHPLDLPMMTLLEVPVQPLLGDGG